MGRLGKFHGQSHFKTFVVGLLACSGLGLTSSENVQAQGRLAQIREQVEPKNDPDKPDQHQPPAADRDDDENRNDRCDRRRSRSSSVCGTSPYWLGGFSTCEPTTVVQVYSPSYASPPVVGPMVPAYAAVPQSTTYGEFSPTVEPMQQIGEPILSESTVLNPEMQIGNDWFQTWSCRGNVLVGGGIDDLSVAGLGLLAIQPQFIGLDTNVKTWRENSSSIRDNLWLGDVNLVYEFLNQRFVRARVGLGVNWLADSQIADAGFNLTTGMSVQVTDKWLLDFEGDIGTLGSADFLHGQVALSRRLETAELSFGYDFYDIGGAKLSAIFGGLQFRF